MMPVDHKTQPWVSGDGYVCICEECGWSSERYDSAHDADVGGRFTSNRWNG